jgi:hypothetical protein
VLADLLGVRCTTTGRWNTADRVRWMTYAGDR